MIRFTLSILLVMLLSITASAEGLFDSSHKYNTLFASQAATGTTAINGTATHLFKTTRAVVAFSCMSSTIATTYLNGSAVVQTGPTASGPWTPLKDKLGNVVSLATGNAFTTFELDTTAFYVRAVWTPATISTNRLLSVYLLGAD
jgi:hypothetical protein